MIPVRKSAGILISARKFTKIMISVRKSTKIMISARKSEHGRRRGAEEERRSVGCGTACRAPPAAV